MAMFKKGGEPKAPKAEKPPKGEKAPKKKADSGEYKPFWVVLQEKRAAGKATKRESSLPKEKMPKEDKIKLMGCTALLIATLIVFVIGSKAANSKKTPAEIAKEATKKAQKDNTPKGQEEE
jgi:hypothetical protein